MKHIVRVQADGSRGLPNRIETFIHCAHCIETRPPTTPARDWAKLEIGIDDEGNIQVWCVRHDVNIAVFRMSVEPVQ
jgi:hypothetical protein